MEMRPTKPCDTIELGYWKSIAWMRSNGGPLIRQSRIEERKAPRRGSSTARCTRALYNLTRRTIDFIIDGQGGADNEQTS